MDLKLKDKVALVTGGSRGLGRAICQALVAEGARVAFTFRQDQAGADELVTQLRTQCRADVLGLRSDVAQLTDIVRALDACEAQFGPLDVLVNNAGCWPTACVQDITAEQWDHTLAVNLRGPFLACREAVRRWLAADRGGRIVNISSPAAFRGSTTGHAHYAASKAGLVNFTISLAREVAARSIFVNAVAPGMMRTEMAREALAANEDHYLQRIPLRRVAEPEEIARVVLFLASEQASYTTGATFDASGGMLMR